MPINLLVEGWRRSTHSYALVNQNQLLQLRADSRFTLFHADMPLFRPEWASVDNGFDPQSQAILAAIPPAADNPVDVVYRASYPLRVFPAPGRRVYVFGTTEFGQPQQSDCRGRSGTPADVDAEGVDFIAPSNWARAGFIKAGFDPERVHLVPHGFDPEQLQPPEAAARRLIREQLRLPADAFVFLNIGAMTWNKGIGPLLVAFALHRQKFPHSLLLLKGADALYGNRLADCRADAEAVRPGAFTPEVTRSIVYIGANLSRQLMAQLHHASDAYLTPYRAEGFSLPTLEALGAGRPVIVTRGGPTDDFCPDAYSLKVDATIRSFGSGMIALEPSVDAIVECMRRVVEDAALRERAAREAHLWAARHYSWSAVTRQLGDLLAG
jgi:glycosyltransferase involved in cell wall biosynthesis